MRRRVSCLLFGCLFTCLAAVPAAAQGLALGERIERYMQPYLAVGHVSGTLLIARKGDVLFEKAWGMADLEQTRANTTATAFLTASVTKPMTMIIASQLVDEELLNVEDLLSRWIPDFPEGGRITVEHLLGHQSGIVHQLTDKGDRDRRRSAADMVELARTRELMFEPGSETAYSSGGYSVLARVLELAGGASYADLLQTRVFAKAGMQQSRDATAGTEGLDVAASYTIGPEGPMRAPDDDHSYTVGAGSVFSTPADLHRLVGALLDGTLGDAARDVIVRPGGFSWNGRTDGYRCFVDYDARDSLEVIFAGNVLSGALDRVRQDVPKIVRGDSVVVPAPIDIRPVAVAPEVLARYVGAYRLRPGFDLELYVEDGNLYASEWLLIPASATTFFSPSDYGTIEIVPRPDGETIERLDWTVGGQTWPCPRVSE